MNLQWLGPVEIVSLILVATMGYVFSFGWQLALKHSPALANRKIYDLVPPRTQVKSEVLSSLFTPIHAVLMFSFGAFGLVRYAPISLWAFLWSFALTFVWTEIWHYISHRVFHMKSLHFIHRQHHRSMTCSQWTALSFSFLEKFIFDCGILGLLGLLSFYIPITLPGIAAFFVMYLFTNSLGHSNIETHDPEFTKSWWGKFANTSTYHALHHSRYVGNYGLLTQTLDRLFKTRWEDYPEVHVRVASGHPLKSLREKMAPKNIAL